MDDAGTLGTHSWIKYQLQGILLYIRTPNHVHNLLPCVQQGDEDDGGIGGGAIRMQPQDIPKCFLEFRPCGFGLNIGEKFALHVVHLAEARLHRGHQYHGLKDGTPKVASQENQFLSQDHAGSHQGALDREEVQNPPELHPHGGLYAKDVPHDCEVIACELVDVLFQQRRGTVHPESLWYFFIWNTKKPRDIQNPHPGQLIGDKLAGRSDRVEFLCLAEIVQVFLWVVQGLMRLMPPKVIQVFGGSAYGPQCEVLYCQSSLVFSL